MDSTEKKTSAKKKTPAKKSAARKTSAKKSSVKKTSDKKASAKKTASSKSKTSVLSVLTQNTDARSANNDGIWLEKKLTDIASKRNGKKEITSKKRNKKDYANDADIARGDIPKSIVEHLSELRSRLLIITGLFMALTIAAFFFSEPIVDFINGPFLRSGHKLNMLKFMGGFLIRLKAAALIALLIMIPVIIFHLWRFTVPALEKNTRKFSLVVILSAVILFYGGAAFVFFLLVPLMVPIMTGLIPSSMNTTIDAESYLSFVVMITIAMGVLFEMPILVLILTRLGVISPQFLISKRKHAIIINFIIAAFVTPQDALSIFFVGIPLVFLYEISIIISKLMVKRANK
ncbi:MAG: twin-arginine translocase subunit TatC [Leptospirales bacterium]|nr:twin-arginine translocase subunit TatC [Leptospirales bacterium]